MCVRGGLPPRVSITSFTTHTNNEGMKMKKVLLATSALALVASAAAAEVSVSGTARMGILQIGSGTAATTYRTRINFSLSGETDGGLTFGAFTRVNINGGGTNAGNATITSNATTVPWSANNQGIFSGSRVYIGNGTFTLTVGNADGAVNAATGVWSVPSVGLTGLGYGNMVTRFNQTSFSSGGAGANVVRLDMSMGNIKASVSGGNGNDTEIGVGFSLGNVNLGLGYDSGAGATGGTTLTAGFDLSGAAITLAAGNYGGTTNWALGLKYGIGGGALLAYAASVGGASNYGIGYNYSLGGGATVKIGVASLGGTTRWDAGVGMKF